EHAHHKSKTILWKMVDELAFATGDGVTCIRPSHPDQYVVFAGQVGNDVAFALAPILAPDENIDTPNLRGCKQVKASSHADQGVCVVRSIREDPDIGIILQCDDLLVVSEMV